MDVVLPIGDTARRLAASVRRRALGISPFGRARRAALDNLARNTPSRPATSKAVAALDSDGIWMGGPSSFERLSAGVSLPRLVALARAFAESREDRPLDGEALWQRYPSVYRIGLATPLLDLAEDYLRTPCLYLGATLKRETADGTTGGTRNWHLDVEDERMLRVLVYLGPVAAGEGPFEYVAAASSDDARAASRYRSGYLSDDRMAALAPPDTWREVQGETGTVVAFDGARLFHRAQPPRRGDRLSVTFAYTSRFPLELRPSSRLLAASRRQLELSDRARACLPPARRF